MVCPAAKKALNDAVVSAKQLKNDLIKVFKEAVSTTGSLSEVDDDKINLINDIQTQKSKICWCADNVKNLTDANKRGEALDNAKDEKKFFELLLTLSKSKFEQAVTRGQELEGEALG